ncbi:MAG: phage N-6-adenine-methyltransferase [Lachnospiraceae bacterium]|nr:phage N-6-adenine-methyltransferase [Lachnospiraceae bacterium]
MDLNSAGGGQTVFCNPPYGKAVKDWVKKCAEEAKKPGTTVVLLIPARTDTSYFHDYIYKKQNVEIRFIRGRLKFGDGKNSAPFPSMLVIFRNNQMAKMTLEEAIQHCKDVAEKLGCCECAEEHKQLAEWLEELQRYREAT